MEPEQIYPNDDFCLNCGNEKTNCRGLIVTDGAGNLVDRLPNFMDCHEYVPEPQHEKVHCHVYVGMTP